MTSPVPRPACEPRVLIGTAEPTQQNIAGPGRIVGSRWRRRWAPLAACLYTLRLASLPEHTTQHRIIGSEYPALAGSFARTAALYRYLHYMFLSSPAGGPGAPSSTLSPSRPIQSAAETATVDGLIISCSLGENAPPPPDPRRIDGFSAYAESATSARRSAFRVSL